MNSGMKYFLLSVVLGIILLFFYFNQSEKKESVVLDDWIAQYLGRQEILLCKKKINNNYYFVSVEGDVYKTGYLLDVGKNINKLYAYIFSWSFQDENNNYLVSNLTPKNIIKNYVYGNNNVYAESIDTRILNIDNPNRIRVSIIYKIYDDKGDIPRGIDDVIKDDPSAEYFLCDTTKTKG